MRADEKQRYTQKVDFAQLKSELQLHEKNDLTLMKSENERLQSDVEKLKQRLREESTRVLAGVRLDLNLEKGRIRDESSQQELKIKEVDTRIESEIAGLRTQIEQVSIEIMKVRKGADDVGQREHFNKFDRYLDGFWCFDRESCVMSPGLR